MSLSQEKNKTHLQIFSSLPRLFLTAFFLIFGISTAFAANDSPRAASSEAQESLSWTMQIIDTGIKPAIALDASDTPHIAYIREAMMGAVLYAVPGGDGWNIEQVSQGYFYGPLDIAVTPDGQPVIAYHDHQGEGFDPRLGDEVVAVREDGAWKLMTVLNPGHDGWDNAIALDADGHWHTSQVDPAQFGSPDGIEYATDAYGDLQIERPGTGPVPYEFATSIALREDDSVGISYFNEPNEDLYFAERTPGSDGTWTLEPVDQEGDVGRYSALAFDSSGTPHITYYAADTGAVRHAWRDADGVWQIEDIDILENVVPGQLGARKITSLDFDSNDVLHVMYSDTHQIRYAIQSDAGWSIQVVYESEGFDLGQLVEFALDSAGKPHLVFFEIFSTAPFDGNIIYAIGE
ncbi:MAG TPA: hypothetical protein VJZ27_08535 [Aggregatilineales bacterium]|nr:hypothetical protein [Aggregatilineales bacterium]